MNGNDDNDKEEDDNLNSLFIGMLQHNDKNGVKDRKLSVNEGMPYAFEEEAKWFDTKQAYETNRIEEDWSMCNDSVSNGARWENVSNSSKDSNDTLDDENIELRVHTKHSKEDKEMKDD